MKLQIFFMKLQIFFMNFEYFFISPRFAARYGWPWVQRCGRPRPRSGGWLMVGKVATVCHFWLPQDNYTSSWTPRNYTQHSNTGNWTIGGFNEYYKQFSFIGVFGHLQSNNVFLENPLPPSKRLKYLFNKTVRWIPPLCVLHKQRVRIIRFLVHVLFQNLLTSIASPGTTARSARH